MTTFKADIEKFRAAMWWAGFEVRKVVELLEKGCTCGHPPRLHDASCPVVNLGQDPDEEWNK